MVAVFVNPGSEGGFRNLNLSPTQIQIRATAARAELEKHPEQNEFGTLLRLYRERSGYSRKLLGEEAGVDPSHINRTERGVRPPPDRDIVLALARALSMSAHETDRLLVAGCYLPVSIERLGPWNSMLQTVTDVLSDPTITKSEREAFKAVVITLAGKWRGK